MINMFIGSISAIMILFICISAYILRIDSVIDKKNPEGSKIIELDRIYRIIKSAAMVYLFSQFKILICIMFLFLTTLYCFWGIYIAFGFFVGFFLSWLSGFLCLYFSVSNNKKVAFSACKSKEQAFDVAFLVGKLVAVVVSLLSIFSCYFIYLYSFNYSMDQLVNMLIGLSLGASLVSVFARIGGGIFTKGADVGADLVGKCDGKFVEDDPRNPAVIADNVGDNVGDAFGMAADLFESFVVIVGGAIAIIIACCGSFEFACNNINLLFVVLFAGALSSIISLLIGWRFNTSDLFSFFNIGFQTVVVSGFVNYFGLYLFVKNEIFSIQYINKIFFAVMLGIVCSIVVMLITEYYTSSKFSPVKSIVDASKQSAANNIIQGLSVGYQAAFIVLLFIGMTLFISSRFSNLGKISIFGIKEDSLLAIAFSCVGIVSICPVVLALDVFGPITDNAGGLIVMSKLDAKVDGKDNLARKVTDELDAIGNTTKANTKGYSVFASGLAAYMLLYVFFSDYQSLNNGFALNCRLDHIALFIGLFVGVGIVSLFVSQCLVAVNSASISIMEEIYSQFKGKEITKDFVPNYSSAIKILTHSSLKVMIVPTLLPVVICVLMFLGMNYYDIEASFIVLVGLVVGVNLAGTFTSLFMTIAGGAWDNAKKYLEIFGKSAQEKNKEQYIASVIGDTVGDPFKDTAGTALNPMIKLIGIVAILILKISF